MADRVTLPTTIKHPKHTLSKQEYHKEESSHHHSYQKLKPFKSTGPDNLAPIHLKHLSRNATAKITKLFNRIINANIIPISWKTARIIPILKPNKDPNSHTSYRPIALLSPLAKILESIIHNIIKPHLPQLDHQHGFKAKHSTTTALHSILDLSLIHI